MVQYDRMVLNHLLDTYENSLLSIGENRRKVQIEFRFTRTSIPAYYDESSSEYEKIHILMNALENKNNISKVVSEISRPTKGRLLCYSIFGGNFG